MDTPQQAVANADALHRPPIRRMNTLVNSRVRIILCCYFLAPDRMLARARRVFRRWPDVRFEVYSTNPRHSTWSGPGVKFSPVENRFNDFSAYLQACRDVARAEEGDRAAVYIFLNDTAFTRHPARLLLRLLRRILPTIARCSAPLLAGRADPYLTLLQTSPFEPGLDRYISTFLFATNFAGMALLDRLFTAPRTRELMECAARLELQGSIPDRFWAFLQLHLRTAETRFSWPGTRLGADAGPKAVCVLLEHLMSAAFFREGFIFPLNGSAQLELLLWAVYRLRRRSAS